MNSVLNPNSQELSLQEQALIELIYALDISVEQILPINISDIILTENLAFLRVGERLVLAAEHSFCVLSNYISNRIRNEDEIHENVPLFIGLNGKRINVEEIWAMVEKETRGSKTRPMMSFWEN